MSVEMFCFQCEQTSKGEGCTKIGVCGKQPEVAALQDLLVYALKGLSQYAIEGRKVGVSDPDVDRFCAKAIFSTLTNVDFDPARFGELINETVKRREAHKEKVRSAGGKTGFTEGPAVFKPERVCDPNARTQSRIESLPVYGAGYRVESISLFGVDG
mgnify:CR=1 FL=1